MAKAAWVINGDKFYTHTSGGAQLLSCDQFRDRIEISDGRVFYFEMNSNGQEEVIIESDVLNIKMVKVSNDPDMSHEDIVEMLATAYEK